MSRQSRSVGVSGSPRRGGNSDLILEKILDGAGTTSDILHLSEVEFSSCVGCERCRTDKICTRFSDGLTPWYERIRDAGNLALVSPVYNYNITSWMKAFIDRLYCFYDFDEERPRGWSSRLAGQGRRAALSVVAEQVHEEDLGVSLEALRLPVTALGYHVVGELPVLGKFDAGIVAEDAGILERAFHLGTLLDR